MAAAALACVIGVREWMLQGVERLGAGEAMREIVAGALQSQERLGADEAERDIAAGTLQLKTYGLPVSWFARYASLLKSRLGVAIKGVAGCVVDDDLVSNVTGYNHRMEQEIARRFGAGAHDQVRADAQNAPN